MTKLVSMVIVADAMCRAGNSKRHQRSSWACGLVFKVFVACIPNVNYNTNLLSVILYACSLLHITDITCPTTWRRVYWYLITMDREFSDGENCVVLFIDYIYNRCYGKQN